MRNIYINTFTSVLTVLFACFLSDATYAQTISFTGPSGITSIPTGTIIELTAVGETSQKHIGSVPTSGYTSPFQAGITCELWQTSYKYGSSGNGVAGKFKYKFTNTTTAPKTITVVFNDITMVHSQPSAITFEDISFTITVEPEYYAKIQSMGFSTVGLRDFNSEYYLVENDVLIRKSSLSIINPVYSVNNDKEHNLNILLSSDVVANPDWHHAIRLATGEYNANPNCDIKLHLVYQYGTLDQVPPYDLVITSDNGVLASNLPFAAEYTNGDGYAGGLIMLNLDYSFNYAQAINNMVHAIGHSLGVKNSVNPVSTIAGMYPLNINSIVTPYLSGISNLLPGWSQSYDMSYYIAGLNYSWNITGQNGTPSSQVDVSGASQVFLPEVSFPVGSYQLQCTIPGGKYSNSITVIKNIVVQ